MGCWLSSTRKVVYLMSSQKPTTGMSSSLMGLSTSSQGYFFLADSLKIYTSPSVWRKLRPSTMSMPITLRNRQSTKMQVNVMCLSPSPLPHVW